MCQKSKFRARIRVLRLPLTMFGVAQDDRQKAGPSTPRPPEAKRRARKVLAGVPPRMTPSGRFLQNKIRCNLLGSGRSRNPIIRRLRTINAGLFRGRFAQQDVGMRDNFGIVITSEARNLRLLAAETTVGEKQNPPGLNFTPTRAKAARVGDPRSDIRDDNSRIAAPDWL
jgi:hypothetical protein